MCLIAKLTGILQRFHNDRRGVSAVEFALVLPLMVILFVGVLQVSELASVKRKTTLVARATADLVAQSQSINQNDLNAVFQAGVAVMAPFDTTPLRIRITSIKIDKDKKASVVWSKIYLAETDAGWVETTGSPTVDEALKVADTHLILSEVSYTHKPAAGYLLTGALSLTSKPVSDKLYMSPRLSNEVKWVN
jgi:Flp pilus assembly protein TadG